jgi:hypothetical protein
VLSVLTLLADGDAELNLQARGLLLRRAVESKTGICPRTPFVVSRTREPRPTSHAHGECLGNPRTRAPIRLLPIRAPRQTELRTSSWLAPFEHRQPLRAAGVKDARCVQPMSATQTNCVYPHLVCSRFALAAFAAGTPLGVLGSKRHDRGRRAFHDARDRFGGSRCNTDLMMSASRLVHERGRFLPTALMRSSL